MAVAPTGAIYKALEFDGVSSRTYGVYITGEAVYNAPERDVKMITIPGRNGSFALDNGRFKNIEVSYPAGIFAETEADFRAAISDFRNFLCSRNGYVRLQDEYNPDEYRMAVYKSGLEVDPAMLKAGEFTITFDCKPQRWLTSGETAVTVTSGDTLTNPTLFESSPLLEASGGGDITFNGSTVSITITELGEISIAGAKQFNSGTSTSFSTSITLDTSNLVSGDPIYVSSMPSILCLLNSTNTANKFRSSAYVSSTTNATASISGGNTQLALSLKPDLSDGYVYGTAKTITGSAVYTYTTQDDYPTTFTETISVSVAYSGSNALVISGTKSGTLPNKVKRASAACVMPPTYADSSKIITPSPVYIDCELGEAYGYQSGELVPYNNLVTLPAILPTLAPSANTITFDNTITDLKIVPRWWKI